MARITYVKAAQQRYETVPVLDPETGQQKVTPVMRGDRQKTTKGGRPVVLRLTTEDKTKLLPNRKCGKCGKEITVGSPYKWIAPKSGPYGGHKLYRCGTCPSWQVWEYSSSLSARLAQVSHDFWEEFSSAEDADAVTSALSRAAEAIREIAQEKRDSAENIESGFNHPTQMSEELTDVADQLESWADEVENQEVLEPNDPDNWSDGDESTCTSCGEEIYFNGDAWVLQSGPPEPDEDQDELAEPEPGTEGTCEHEPEPDLGAWRDELLDTLTLVDEPPV